MYCSNLLDLNSDVLKAKRANNERVREFSKNLLRYNQSVLQQQRKLPQSSEMNDIEIVKQKMVSKRERALMFAKNNVPKPKVSSSLAVDQKGNEDADRWDNEDDDYMRAPDAYGMGREEACRIDELEAKHLDSKRQIEAIKRSLNL